MLSSYLDRARDAATSQLFGLFGKDLSWPLPEPTENGFRMSLPTLEEDFIIRADDDSCTRIREVIDGVKNASGTISMLERFTAFFESEFFPHIRTLTG